MDCCASKEPRKRPDCSGMFGLDRREPTIASGPQAIVRQGSPSTTVEPTSSPRQALLQKEPSTVRAVSCSHFRRWSEEIASGPFGVSVKEAATTISNASSASTVSSRPPKALGLILYSWLLWIQPAR
jgi:hypothetical protein